METETKKKFSYKWVMIALCFIMVGVSLGFCSSPGQLYISAITNENALGFARSAYAFTNTFRFVSTAIINLFFGTLIAKFGPKRLIFAGFTCLITANLIYSFASELWVFYIGGIFLGLGFSWTTTTMIGYVVILWCRENKGTIMGAILASNGIFGAIAMKLIGYLINRNADPFGYRDAYRIVVLILIAVALLVLIFFKTSPNDTDTSNISKKKSRGRSWTGLEYSKTVKTAYFWLAIACVFLTGMTLQGVSGISSPHMEAVGLDKDYITTVLAIHSIALTFFKFIVGFLYDRFGLRVTTGICYVTSALVMTALVLLTNSPEGKVLAMFYGVFSSLALPLETIMLPIIAGDLFGERSFNKILGIIVSANTAGYAVGSPLSNLCFDLTGSYSISICIGISLIVIIMVIMQIIINRANRYHKEAEALDTAG